MHERGYLGPEVTPEYWITHYNRWIPFDPEALKRLLDEYCVAAGVEIRYFTRVIDADVDGRTRQRRDHQQRRRAQRSSRPRPSSTAPATPCWPTLAAPSARSPGATGRSSRRRCARPSPASTGTIRPTTPTRGTDAIREKVEGRISCRRPIADGHFTQPDHFIAGHEQGRPHDRQPERRPHLRPRRPEREEPVGRHDRRPQGRGRIHGVLPQIRAGLRAHRAARRRRR